ncbi:Outer membrane autotransporter protein [Pleurostoma richardsiae]|uniref:Outer membrane autotransporter protein n=1 Tax=Pleurostoma richardsiae TaxID=41990 RepID=A0AA38S1G5_9PEZI|nr:Outer membrane autotransporter protein [Pleurostoma richardsiae]
MFIQKAVLACLTLGAWVASAAAVSTSAPVNVTTCNGKQYIYNQLAGYGFVPGNATDKYGDTISIGSSITIESWHKVGRSYEALLWGLPDRGWNTNGTVNFIPRIHKYYIKFTPNPCATLAHPSGPNLEFAYLDTILFRGPDGTPCTGLDADATGGLDYDGFPTLPAATYTGDGFGGVGPGGKRVTLDCEGLVITDDGSFWISDEYGPYIYHFDATGLMIGAVRPPDAILPLRNGTVSFSADSPPLYDPSLEPTPTDPTQGRQNNQGFEGLTISPDGKTLYTLLQSAAEQEGGAGKTTRRDTRFLKYNLEGPAHAPTPVYAGEWVVPLPTYINEDGKVRVAAQSEVHYISDTQFMFLPRDSSAGRAQDSSESLYRHVDIFDISGATNVIGTAHDSFNTSIASTVGVLNSDITAATVCPFLDFNLNSQLGRFGLHNGGDQDAALLNEKWESIALLPVSEGSDEYYLFSASDDDFITQDGWMDGGKIAYADASGFSLDNQVLVFKVTLPKGSTPLTR